MFKTRACKLALNPVFVIQVVRLDETVQTSEVLQVAIKDVTPYNYLKSYDKGLAGMPVTWSAANDICKAGAGCLCRTRRGKGGGGGEQISRIQQQRYAHISLTTMNMLLLHHSRRYMSKTLHLARLDCAIYAS